MKKTILRTSLCLALAGVCAVGSFLLPARAAAGDSLKTGLEKEGFTVQEGKDYSSEDGFFSAGNEQTGLYHPIFGSIGNSLNMNNILHDGSSAYGTNAVMVVSANQTVTEKVVKQLKAAGYPESVINVMPIPEDTYRMGLDKGDDTFCLLGRVSQPKDKAAYFNDTNAQGDNRDAAYVMTKDFTLDSDEDFVVVYGVNHTTSGKAIYSNAVLYGRPMLNGACSIYDSLFAGSAKEYLEKDCENADQYYVYKIARTKMDDYTAILPYSTGNTQGKYYGLDNGNPMLLAFRAYLDENNVGTSYYELIYDRAIVFHKK